MKSIRVWGHIFVLTVVGGVVLTQEGTMVVRVLRASLQSELPKAPSLLNRRDESKVSWPFFGNVYSRPVKLLGLRRCLHSRYWVTQLPDRHIAGGKDHESATSGTVAK